MAKKPTSALIHYAGENPSGVDLAIGAIGEEVAEQAEVRYLEEVYWLAPSCESPIEKLMLAALVAELNVEFSGRDGSISFSAMRHLPKGKNPAPWSGIYLYAQVPVGRFRVDFMLDCWGYDDEHHQIAIECDGHEFHDRTKEQAARDKSRDRQIAAQGVTVLRFTGSEIWREPVKCARDVIDVVNKKVLG